MAQLVRSACTLGFSEFEFVDFFGMVSPLDEEECSYSYSVRRDGLRLEFTMFPVDGDVYADLYRDGVTGPVFKSRLQACTHSRFVLIGSRRCLEIGRPQIPTSETSVPLSWGLRLSIDPHLALEYLHEES